MNIIKELFKKQNKILTIKFITYPIYWFIICYATMYAAAIYLDYNTVTYGT
jgi:hypothetical protein